GGRANQLARVLGLLTRSGVAEDLRPVTRHHDALAERASKLVLEVGGLEPVAKVGCASSLAEINPEAPVVAHRLLTLVCCWTSAALGRAPLRGRSRGSLARWRALASAARPAGAARTASGALAACCLGGLGELLLRLIEVALERRS